MDTQESRGCNNLVDTDTELENDTVHDTEYLEYNINKKLLILFLKIYVMMKFLMKKLILMLLKRQILKWKILLKLHN